LKTQHQRKRWVGIYDIGHRIWQELKVGGEKTMDSTPKREWKTRVVRGGFPDRSFDIEFWQALGDEAIFNATWEMIVMAEELKHGRQPRFDRTVTHVERRKR
jgi:hypothetical protein